MDNPSQKTPKPPKPLVVPTLFVGSQMSRFFNKHSPEDIINHVKSTENPQELQYLSYSLDKEVLKEIISNQSASLYTLGRIEWTLKNIPSMENPKLLKLVKTRIGKKQEQAKKNAILFSSNKNVLYDIALSPDVSISDLLTIKTNVKRSMDDSDLLRMIERRLQQLEGLTGQKRK